MEEETLTLKPHPPTSDEEGDPNHDADTAMADLLHQNPNSPPNSGSDSDSDSDSDSEDDEAQDNLQLQTLENDLAINPSNYDAHVQYIKLLRKIGDIEKLRRAREAMSELFPLTPAMWQDWARDESSLIAGTESFSAIEKLYERGVSDYLVSSGSYYANMMKISLCI
ncbi:squamous cell carcinoma antigen recognized by T-cells 3-like, partial [Morus notabilis]|uniref:squamous cell carcinoma antigen recognized by T-cells 3-like n=1 Tax=Morus notabilis TaxID=981085 RepID=UPI000CED0507